MDDIISGICPELFHRFLAAQSAIDKLLNNANNMRMGEKQSGSRLLIESMQEVDEEDKIVLSRLFLD